MGTPFWTMRASRAITTGVCTFFFAGCAVLDPLAPAATPAGWPPSPILHSKLPSVQSALLVSNDAKKPTYKSAEQMQTLEKPIPDGTPPPQCEFGGCIEKAVEYGEAWRSHYYREARYVALWRNTLLGSIIPISAFALYRGTYSDNAAKLVAGYAAVAGTAYGLTRYFGLPEQQKAYLVGADAITCTLLNARKLMVPLEAIDTLNDDLNTFQRKLNKAQAAYSKFRLAHAYGLAEDEQKALESRVLKPVERRLSFYERTFRRARSVYSDSLTSGEALRRQIDMITNATAVEVIKSAPNPEKILEFVGEFRGFADKIGQGAFPPPATPPAATDSTTTPATTTVAEALAKLPPLDEVKKEVQVTIGAQGDAATAIAMDLQDFLFDESKKKALPRSYDVKQKLVEKLSQNQTASNASKANVTTLDLLAQRISNAYVQQSIKAAEAAKKSAAARAAARQPAQSIFDQLLREMKGAETLEFHLTSKDPPLEVKGTFTRPPTDAESDAEKDAKEAQRERKEAVAEKVAGWATKGEKMYRLLADAGLAAEAVYHQIVGWDVSDSIPPICKGEKAKEPAPFTISPQLTEVTLAKDKPIVFAVSNDKSIPKVVVSGQNTDKIKTTIGVMGDDFTVTVVATGAIPDGQEAVLAITDSTGKRKFEIKIDATAP